MTDERLESIEIEGFDPDGDPTIHKLADGKLQLVFEFMPPSWAMDETPEAFDTFDQQLASAIGTPVIWEDREFFLIERPQADTVQRIRQFLEALRRDHDDTN